MKTRRKPHPHSVSELLILPDGRVLVHNLTTTFARFLRELNPAENQINARAKVADHPPESSTPYA